MPNHRSWTTLCAVIALGTVALVSACDDEDDELTGLENGAQVFVAQLRTIEGNSEVAGDITGTATFTIDENGEMLLAEVNATGLDPDMVHPQHIHAGSACPGPEADTNGDGFIDVVEGAPSYGGILVPLDTDLTDQAAGDFPQGSTIDYQQQVSFGALVASLRGPDDDPFVELELNQAFDLGSRHVVLHGVNEDLPATVASIDGTPANVTLPVACGRIIEVRDDD